MKSKFAWGIIAIVAALLGDPVNAQNPAAHEHGVGEMNVVLDGQKLQIEFHAPGANITGFEHTAETQADITSVKAALEILGDSERIILLPAAAKCRAQEAEAETSLLDDDHAHDKNHDHDPKGGHDDDHGGFSAHYAFVCADPKQLSHFEVKLFSLFPSLREIHVQRIGPNGQSGMELSKSQPVVSMVN